MTLTTRRFASACSRTTRRTAASTATGCCSLACSIPPGTGSTAIFLRAAGAMAGRWALPRSSDERPLPLLQWPLMLCHCVFDSLHGASPDDLSCGLGLKYRGFLCERINTLSRLCSWFLDDNEFCEPRHKENSRFLEFFIAYAGE